MNVYTLIKTIQTHPFVFKILFEFIQEQQE